MANQTTARRLSPQQVMARTKTGAPRMIYARFGNPEQSLFCMCPTPGECSHIRAVRELLTAESSAQAGMTVAASNAV